MTYAISSNRQKPLAGTFDAAIFNSWRRFRTQVLYWAPPFIIAYSTMRWAVEKYVEESRPRVPTARIGADILDRCRNEYLNSKAGRAEQVEEAE